MPEEIYKCKDAYTNSYIPGRFMAPDISDKDKAEILKKFIDLNQFLTKNLKEE